VVEKVDHIFPIFPTPRDTACSKGLVQEFSWQLAPIAQGVVTQFSSQSMGETLRKIIYNWWILHIIYVILLQE
jgi:hypothetical protein